MASGSAPADDDEPIFSLAEECEALFLRVLSQLKSSRADSLPVFEEYQQRFMSWTAYLGVFAKRKLCLDHRLRNHPDLQDLVLRLLDILSTNLMQITTAQDTVDEESLEMSSSSEGARRSCPRANNDDILEAIDGAIDRLNRLGIAIRQSSTRSLVTRGGVDISDLNSFKELAALVLRALYPEANGELLDQLSKSMAERFGNISSRQSRQAELRKRRPKGPTSLSPIVEGIGKLSATEVPTGARMVSEPQHRRMAERPVQPTRVQRWSNPLSSQASSIDRQALQQKLSSASHIGSQQKETSSIQIGQVGYPKAPQGKSNPNFLTCEWCFETRERRYFEGDEWRKHVDNDLRPYVCISENCSESTCAFPTFKTWQDHMLSQHGISWHQEVHPPSSWVCAVCYGPSETFHDSLALYKHMKEGHQFTENQLEAIVRQSRVQVRRRPDVCPLCCLPVEEDQTASTSTSAQQYEDSNPGKRQQEPPLPESTPKRARMSADSGNTASSATESRVQLHINERVELRNIKDPKFLHAEIMARHVVAHLRSLMFLNIRLMSIRHNEAESVSIASSSAYTGGNSTRKMSPWVDSDTGDGTRMSISDGISSTDEDHSGDDPADQVPDTAVDANWDDVAWGGAASFFQEGIEVWYDSPDVTVDICFVHGLTSGRDSTWTAEGQSTPWPRAFLPPKLVRARILTYGYDPSVAPISTTESNQLMDHATNLLNNLTAERASCNALSRPLIFVAHGFGGLVCKAAIILSLRSHEAHLRDIFNCTEAIAFMGTPHKGSWMLGWAKTPASALGIMGSTNKSLMDIVGTDSAELEALQLTFDSMILELRGSGRRLDITCFYEKLPLPVVGIVTSEDSASLDSGNKVGILANHIEMVKFQSTEAIGFKNLLSDLTRWELRIRRTVYNDATIVFAFGWTGLRNKIQCSRLVDDYGFTYLSADDLLREGKKPEGSQLDDMIYEAIPIEDTVRPLKNKVVEVLRDNKEAKFLINGFPPNIDQALIFEELVYPPRLALYFDYPEYVLPGHAIDNYEIDWRDMDKDDLEDVRILFQHHVETRMPVINYLLKQGKMHKANTFTTADEVYKDIQRVLAEHGIVPEHGDLNIRATSKDGDGLRLLPQAAMKGHEAVVRLLLDTDDTEVNWRDEYGQTALLWAAEEGHEGIVRLLVEQSGLEVDSKDIIGRTSLSCAAGRGYEAIVRLLLKQDGVNVNSKDKYGQTPLARAAEEGHEAIVRLLIQQDDVEVDAKDKYGRTPLSRAAEEGHETIFRLLVKRDDVNADSKELSGRTPLSRAAEQGHEAIVRLLVTRDDVKTYSRDLKGRTPLWWAESEGHKAIIQLLEAKFSGG